MPARLLAVLVAVLASVAASLVGLVPAASAADLTSTTVVVLRPVTSTGHRAAGYTVRAEPDGGVDCSFPEASPAALNKNIELCSPSAAYAVACWKAAATGYALCLRDVKVKRLAKIPLLGSFAATRRPSAARRAPLAFRLANGLFCTVRDGGAGPSLDAHPDLFATYYCGSGVAVWASAGSRHLGVNESHPVWRVRTSKGGAAPLVTRRVTKAWFVGTKAV